MPIQGVGIVIGWSAVRRNRGEVEGLYPAPKELDGRVARVNEGRVRPPAARAKRGVLTTET